MKLSTLKPRVGLIGTRLPVMQPGSWRTDAMTSSDRGYGHKWRQARLGWLRKHPLCVYCLVKIPAQVTEAEIVDHIIPHRGDMVAFWDSASNWQSLCITCHNTTKVREESELGYR